MKAIVGARFVALTAGALTLAFGACAGGERGTGTGSESSTGSPASTGSPTGTGSGSSASSGSGGIGASTGTTTGAGCSNGDPGGLPEGALCLFPFDCVCGLACGQNVSGVGGSLVCERPCVSNFDCPLPGEHCQTDVGFCQGGLGGSCSAVSPNLEFYGCRVNADCPCPLECYGDPSLGPVCERPCSDTSDCADAGEFCNVRVGSCEQTCNPQGQRQRYQSCLAATDCRCPLSCFDDPRRGQVCERPCVGDGDCAGDEVCETDAGSCQRTTDCFGSAGGVPEFSACSHVADCACPFNCVDDPALRPPGSTATYRFCELCDGGSCRSVSGSCTSPGDGGFQSSDVYRCRSNSDCTCPNTCLASADSGVLRCEQTCTQRTDCDDPAQTCFDAECVENVCFGQLLCDLANGRDAPPLVGDGTCLRLPPFQEYVCRANGTALAECDPEASLSQTAELCGRGYTCIENIETGGFTCARACALDTDCGARGLCAQSVGLCSLVDDAGVACPFGAFPNDGGECQYGVCQPPLPGQLQSSDAIQCFATQACACPSECVPSHRTKGQFLCERPCDSTADCDDPGQFCLAGQCTDDTCSGATAVCDVGGGFGLPPDAGKGTCLPALDSEGLNCFAPGVALGSCSAAGPRSDSAEHCALGLACLPVLDGGLACLPSCFGPVDCAPGQACVRSVIDGISLCLPLGDGGSCAVGQSSPPASAECSFPGDSACGCSYGCVQGACEQSCQQDSECLVPGDICVGTVAQSYCVPGPG